ncbi:MAG: amidohydrolase family protein [Pseudomonadota bacterium]
MFLASDQPVPSMTNDALLESQSLMGDETVDTTREDLCILDSHVHFCDLARPEGVVWPEANSSLFRTMLPSDWLAAMQPRNAYGCIAVETSRRPEDDEWLLALAQREPLVRGVVLNLQPDNPGFSERLGPICQAEAFVGIRLRPIVHYDLAADTLRDSLALLHELQKTIEFGARDSTHKRQFAELASAYPNTTWILDHCGHPTAPARNDTDWKRAMADIAARSNTVVKISGLAGEIDTWRATFDYLLELFGPTRLLYGSNWPVSTLHEAEEDRIGTFARWLGNDRHAFLVGNAARVYGVAPSDAGASPHAKQPL